MHFISFDKVKWYNWFYLIPWIIFALIYSLIVNAIIDLYGKFLAYCMDKKG